MIVVDEGVALKWFVVEEGAAEARALIAAGETLVAPDLLVAEVCNAGWKACRSGRISPEQLEQMADRLSDLLTSLAPSAPLARQALAIARVIDRPVTTASISPWRSGSRHAC